MKEDDLDIKIISLEQITNQKINNLLAEYFVDSKIDDDGDVIIKGPVKIYIKADEEEGAVRIFSFIHLNEEIEAMSLSEQINTKNKGSSTVKYSIMKNAIMAEYGILLYGYIDHKLLIKTVKHFEDEVISTRITLSEYIAGWNNHAREE